MNESKSADESASDKVVCNNEVDLDIEPISKSYHKNEDTQ